MESLYVQARNAIVQEFSKHGKRIINECVNERTYKHDTFNLHDSYGYGVYVEGKLMAKGTLSKEATESKKWYGEKISGHDEIIEFLNSYKASNGVELVVVAAMPYAEVLENASSGQHRKYKVISMSYDKLQVIADANPELRASVNLIARGKKQ